ncbi:PREDICTED: 72 kDa inositol polyphosphate 5-phosphatase-like [Amphimedon queenslandica]|uniref:Inositol polyphosphate-related phosphatase domain-containing protein n=1 Tax=Amphimedon queenslandica TaxID=400682 RepID=A0A1X7VA75_AMPQE|nr:PREDICTED: 72 kDa inositol polyphosphate 5-phosphatase-like [Amphimedon queenslandica]|eukprot:XP_019849786.1 PREDICTED: 72 kDa inositol polyphosphate 5-phosphatase-like [Amphimedon queenslandica]
MATQHGGQELPLVRSHKSSSSSSSGSTRERRVVLRSKKKSTSQESFSSHRSIEHRGHMVTSTPLQPIRKHQERGREVVINTRNDTSSCSSDDNMYSPNTTHFLPPISMLTQSISHQPSRHSFLNTSPHYPLLTVPIQVSASPTTPTISPLPQLLTHTVRSQFSPDSADQVGGGGGVIQSLLPDCNLKIFVGTWNMHEEKSLPVSIDDFILPLSQQTLADLYAIGTQESTPLKNDWEVLLQQTLGPSHVLIHSSSLGCIYLCLFLRRDLIWFCSSVLSSSVATRPVTAIKTKGAVAVRLSLFGSSFLFITSHFSAGFSNVMDRNADMHKIASNLSFPGIKTNRLLESHNYVFWFGDFNYRVELERETVDDAIQNSELMSLLLNDQLTREILAGNVFNGFSEQPISFPPSYKFDINSYCYDTSDLVRIPSWTDRVLFLANDGRIISGSGYDLCPSILISDHRPVYAIFNAVMESKSDISTELPTSYNRELYIRALQRRKQLFSTKPLHPVTSNVSSSSKNKPFPSTTASAPPPTVSRNSAKSSSVCHIL